MTDDNPLIAEPNYRASIDPTGYTDQQQATCSHQVVTRNVLTAEKQNGLAPERC